MVTISLDSCYMLFMEHGLRIMFFIYSRGRRWNMLSSVTASFFYCNSNFKLCKFKLGLSTPIFFTSFWNAMRYNFCIFNTLNFNND